MILAATTPALSTLLLQIALIIILSRAIGYLFVRLHQPQVIGEMLAGIMLGPSLLGRHFPGLSESLFPPHSLPALNTLSQLGVVIFLFLVGLELDLKLIRSAGRAAAHISWASIAAPFALGASFTILFFNPLFPEYDRSRLPAVALFMGAAMSVTAFPVLARILTERNLHRTRIGAVSITSAAMNDVAAWCVLAFVVAIARAAGAAPALLTLGGAAAYLAVMFLLVRPFLRRLQAAHDVEGALSQYLIALIFLLILASAYATERIGIHALFGAFVIGVAMPKGTQFVRTLTEKLEDFTVVFLLPLFFAYTGLKTQIGLLNSPTLWGYAALLIAVACAGKFGGAFAAARFSGMPPRDAAAVGVLMNTRGLMELVILDIGRSLGVINDAVFAMMVIMALVTTAATTPLLHLVFPPRLQEEELAAAARAGRKAFSVLIPVSLPKSAAPLLRIARLFGAEADQPPRVYALHLRRPNEHEAYHARPAAEPSTPPLQAMLAAASDAAVPIEPLTFPSTDVPADIARVARAYKINLLLMGFHKAVFGQAVLGGTVHRVLTTAATDTAIFVDRNPDAAPSPFTSRDPAAPPLRVLVPYLGSRHDLLALSLAHRLVMNSPALVTVLHVVAPDRPSKGAAAAAVDSAFAEPGAKGTVNMRVLEHPSPIDAVLAEAPHHDLILLGIGEEFGLESHLFGFRPERIAVDSPTPLLIVRRGN